MNKTLAKKQRLLDLNALFGKRLAELRKERNLTQSDIAEVIGYGRPLVSKIEHGQRALNILEIFDYATALSLEPEILLDELRGIVLEYDSARASQAEKR